MIAVSLGHDVPLFDVAFPHSFIASICLTPLGRSLQAPFASLYLWTVEHMDTIRHLQAKFDSRQA